MVQKYKGFYVYKKIILQTKCCKILISRLKASLRWGPRRPPKSPYRSVSTLKCGPDYRVRFH